MKDRMKRGLPGPRRNEVKIWFQGETGSGKTLIAQIVHEALRAKGLKLRCEEWRMGYAMEDQIVDLTHQNIDDVLTVDVGVDGMMKLLEEEVA
jgi:hypothetical protein